MLVNFKALLWLTRNQSYRLGSGRCSSLQLWRMISGPRVTSPLSTWSWVKEKILVTSNFVFRLSLGCEMAVQKGQSDRDLWFSSAKRRLTLPWHLVSQKKLITVFFLCCWVTLLWEKTETAMSSMNSWNHKSHWDYSQLLLKETDSTTNIVFH